MAVSNWSELLESADDNTDFTPLPEGDYNLIVSESEVVTSQSGKTGFKIVATVLDGQYEDRKVFNTFYVSPESPKAMGIFFRQMSAIGLDKEFFAQEPTDEDIADALMEGQFVGTLKHTVNNGKTYANLSNVQPLTAGASSSAPASKPAAKKAPVASKPAGAAAPAKRKLNRKLPDSPMGSPV